MVVLQFQESAAAPPCARAIISRDNLWTPMFSRHLKPVTQASLTVEWCATRCAPES
jgi:hypothetical protein